MGKVEGHFEDWSELMAAVLRNPDARTGYLENGLRREFGKTLSRKIIQSDPPRHVDGIGGLNRNQVRRLLHEELGGNITLSQMVRVADDLGFDLKISWVKQSKEFRKLKDEYVGDEDDEEIKTTARPKDGRCASCLNADYNCPDAQEGVPEAGPCPADEEDDE